MYKNIHNNKQIVPYYKSPNVGRFENLLRDQGQRFDKLGSRWHIPCDYRDIHLNDLEPYLHQNHHDRRHQHQYLKIKLRQFLFKNILNVFNKY